VSLISQLIGTGLGIAIALTGSFVVYATLKRLVGIRLGAEDEFDGADLSIHKINSMADD